MSLDATSFGDTDADWYSTIPTIVIDDWLNTDTFRFTHVTTANNVAFNTMNDSGTLVAAVAGTDYISFSLSFRSTETAAPSIYWKDVELVSSTPVSWRCDVPTFVNGEGATITNTNTSLYSAAHAIRIGVVGTANNIVYESADTATADTLIGNTVLGEHSVALTNVDLSTANGSVAYYLAKNGSLPSGVTNVIVPATVTDPIDLDVTALDAAKPLVVLTGSANQWFGTVTVNIWVEGWDPDCFNSILRDVITTSLVFSTEFDPLA
jgi:hypothetical protein